jgi:hypothetical protein
VYDAWSNEDLGTALLRRWLVVMTVLQVCALTVVFAAPL